LRKSGGPYDVAEPSKENDSKDCQDTRCKDATEGAEAWFFENSRLRRGCQE